MKRGANPNSGDGVATALDIVAGENDDDDIENGDDDDDEHGNDDGDVAAPACGCG